MADRTAYEQKIDAQMNEWRAKLDELKAKAEKSEADTKIKYQKEAKDVSSRLEALKLEVDKMKNSSQDKWEELKLKVDQTARDMGTRFEEMKNKLGMN